MLSRQQLTTETALLNTSILLERFAYYGSRSILVLFLIKSTIRMDEYEALELYGLFIGAGTLSRVFGGLISDLVLGSKRASIIGGFIQAAGFALLTVPMKTGVYAGLGMIVLGSALYVPSVYARMGRSFLSRPDKMDGAFSLSYCVVNIGAFLGSLVITATGGDYSFYIGFGLSAVAMLGSSVLLIFLSDKEPYEPVSAPGATGSSTGMLIVAGTVAAFMCYWICYTLSEYEPSEMIRTQTGPDSFNTLYLVAPVIITFLFSGLLAVLWFFWKVNTFIKIGTGFILTAAGFYLLSHTTLHQDNHFMLLVFFLIVGIGESLAPAVFYSAIARHAPPRFLATIIGGTSLFIGFLTNKICMVTRQLENWNWKSIAETGLWTTGAVILIVVLATGGLRRKP